MTRRRCLRKLRDVLGWSEWKKDVLRHSAATYWLASEPDAAKVAMELGNSPQVLMKHYRELVTDEQAKEFWNLTPKKVDVSRIFCKLQVSNRAALAFTYGRQVCQSNGLRRLGDKTIPGKANRIKS